MTSLAQQSTEYVIIIKGEGVYTLLNTPCNHQD